MFDKLFLFYKIKRLFYRYNLKRKDKEGRIKKAQDFALDMAKVYCRLPVEEQKIMLQKLQAIIDLYNKVKG